jgi:hypothetical protein
MYRRRNEGWSKKVDIVTLSTMEKSVSEIRKLAEGRDDSVLIIKEVEMLERALAWAQGRLSDFDLTKHRMPEHLKKAR